MKEQFDLTPYLEKGVSYEDYRQLTIGLAAAGKTTGPDQSENYVHYTVLNAQRIKRGDKTIELVPELKQIITSITQPVYILVINEAWCGDGAQIIPVFGKIKEASPLIDLKVVLRDEHPELMDQYLTDGTKRSIPVFIILDHEKKELFHWGSKPVAVQQLINSLKAEGMEADLIKEKQHLWYARDRGVSIQQELLEQFKNIQHRL